MLSGRRVGDEAMSYTHPGEPRHVMRCYRQYVLNRKRKNGTARGIIHYRRILDEYLAAKRVVVEREEVKS